MSIRIRRLFPERPLARKDYPGWVLRATLQWGSPPPAGCVRFTDRPNELTPPQQRDFSTSLHVAEEGEKAVGFLHLLSHPRLLQVTVVRAEGEVFAALIGHALTAGGERPLLGFAPDSCDNRLALRAPGLTVPEGAVSGPGGLPWSLFHSDLPPGCEAVSEGWPC